MMQPDIAAHSARMLWIAVRSPPAERRSDVREDRLYNMGIIVDPELVGDREQQRVGLGNGFVLFQFFNQNIRLICIGAAKYGTCVGLDISELVRALVISEIRPVAIIDQRENATADRYARLMNVPRLLPCSAKRMNLLRLLDVKRLSALIEFESGTLQVHTQFRGPFGCGVRGRTPPDPLAEPFRMGLDAKKARWIWKHRPRIGFGKAVAAQYIQQY